MATSNLAFDHSSEAIDDHAEIEALLRQECMHFEMPELTPESVGYANVKAYEASAQQTRPNSPTSQAILQIDQMEAATKVHKNIFFAVITAISKEQKAAHKKSKHGPRPAHAHRHISLRSSPEDAKNLLRVDAMCRRAGLPRPTFLTIAQNRGKSVRASFKVNPTEESRLTGPMAHSGFYPTRRAAKRVCVEKLLALIDEILADYGLEVSYDEYFNLPRDAVEAMDAMYLEDEPISVINRA